jgi:hypothetical protein
MRLALVCLSACLVLACASTSRHARPARPAPDAAIAPFAFLEGTWVLEQANGAVIEESWSAPRGKAVLGSFRRVLGDGRTPFWEFTQIVATPEGVRLRQLHVHADFETDPRRAKPMVLQLEALEDGKASFVPVSDAKLAAAGSLQRVTYQRIDAETLLLVVEERPAKEGAAPGAPLSFRMRRESRGLAGDS